MSEFIDSLETPIRKEGKPQGNTFKFNNLAIRFVDCLSGSGNYPLYHNGRFYLYRDNRYVEETDLDNCIRTFFKRENIPQSNNVVGNVKSIVQNIAYRALSEFGSMPFYLGKEAFPKPSNIIAYQNGLLDIERYLAGDLTLIPHTPKWASTVCLPYEFDPAADCPTWLAFLGQVFEGDQDRIDLATRMVRLLAGTRHQPTQAYGQDGCAESGQRYVNASRSRIGRGGKQYRL